MIRSLVCSMLLLAAPWFAVAQEQPGVEVLGVSDARAVRAVVEAQVRALAADQDGQAFAYATPRIQDQFRDAGTFGRMVRSSYPMLIRPASMSFFQAQIQLGVVVQAVQFHDREGRIWRAVYELQHQPDGRWLINGCAVAPDEETSTA